MAPHSLALRFRVLVCLGPPSSTSCGSKVLAKAWTPAGANVVINCHMGYAEKRYVNTTPGPLALWRNITYPGPFPRPQHQQETSRRWALAWTMVVIVMETKLAILNNSKEYNLRDNPSCDPSGADTSANS